VNAGAAPRLHFPDGELPAGERHRAVCHCGYRTTPRARRELAAAALLEEHGWSAAEHGCAVCGWSAEDVRIGERVAGRRITASPPYPWEVYRPLRAGEDIDGGREVWVCQDEAACHERYDQARIEGATNAERELLGLAVVLPFRRPAR
jgi:hypothetical protein